MKHTDRTRKLKKDIYKTEEKLSPEFSSRKTFAWIYIYLCIYYKNKIFFLTCVSNGNQKRFHKVIFVKSHVHPNQDG